MMMRLWYHSMSFPYLPLFLSNIRKKLEQDDTLASRTNLTIDDIISLLDFTLSYNYSTIHVLYSPVSPVVANICMEVIENTAIETTQTKPKTWKRFVDDSFSIIKKTAITSSSTL